MVPELVPPEKSHQGQEHTEPQGAIALGPRRMEITRSTRESAVSQFRPKELMRGSGGAREPTAPVNLLHAKRLPPS